MKLSRSILWNHNARRKEQVRKGAKLLDRIRPSWFKEISSGNLDLTNCSLCVLGQLYKPENDTDGHGHYKGSGYSRGLNHLTHLYETGRLKIPAGETGRDIHDTLSRKYGFDGDVPTELWKYEIQRRRAAAYARAKAAA